MDTIEIATFAGGCFWCTEAIFQRLKGVTSVKSGYTGGTVDNPTYSQVCLDQTGHAEAIQIIFDPKIISYQTLLEIFFATHDPTTRNQQGADIGTQYRSAIFYHSDEQKKIIESIKEDLQKKQPQGKLIVTEIVPYNKFYEAEEYHKDFYNRNNSQMYCQIVIDPKIKKLIAEFSSEVKDEYLKI